MTDFEAGWAAYEDGFGRDANPFGDQDRVSDAEWTAGWEAACDYWSDVKRPGEAEG